MIVEPTVGELLTKVSDRYELVLITAIRARQLTQGAQPLTLKKEPSAVSIAAREIAEGKVNIINKEG